MLDIRCNAGTFSLVPNRHPSRCANAMGRLHTVILADDHVLDGFPRAGHVHGVRQVCPSKFGVVDLLFQHLVCVVPHYPRNVIVLHRSTFCIAAHRDQPAQKASLANAYSLSPAALTSHCTLQRSILASRSFRCNQHLYMRRDMMQ